jgi:hypothetical protein
MSDVPDRNQIGWGEPFHRVSTDRALTDRLAWRANAHWTVLNKPIVAT